MVIYQAFWTPKENVSLLDTYLKIKRLLISKHSVTHEGHALCKRIYFDLWWMLVYSQNSFFLFLFTHRVFFSSFFTHIIDFFSFFTHRIVGASFGLRVPFPLFTVIHKLKIFFEVKWCESQLLRLRPCCCPRLREASSKTGLRWKIQVALHLLTLAALTLLVGQDQDDHDWFSMIPHLTLALAVLPQ